MGEGLLPEESDTTQSWTVCALGEPFFYLVYYLFGWLSFTRSKCCKLSLTSKLTFFLSFFFWYEFYGKQKNNSLTEENEDYHGDQLGAVYLQEKQTYFFQQPP